MRSSVEEIKRPGYERVTIFKDSKTGLSAVIAIHNTALGPALGGCRMKAYPSMEAAIYDVLRLAEGMSWKNSLAGLNLGGGKSVILGDRDKSEGRKELFLEFAQCVKFLGGKYVTAEDMGTRVSDMDVIAGVCPHVAGRGLEHGGGGDPSPHTAEGVLQGMRAALGFVFGSEDFTGRHIAIQGVGSVGFSLAQKLLAAGAKVTIADTRPKRLEKVRRDLKAEVVSIDQITKVECDILSPCAVGAVINPDTLGDLKCRIIAGGANNQLSSDEVETELKQKNIIYVPDFAVNSGGVILCAGEHLEGGYNETWVKQKVANIYRTVSEILSESEASGQLTGAVALEKAKKRMKQHSGFEGN